ncbi:MAG: hypothetical protein GXO55_10100 [Chloroflexi bacterium]|nr:hypothetical protein [Chloroflexota bacterium]
MGRIRRVVLILIILYLLVGLGFHWQWKQAQHACDDLLRARGEFVEPEIFPVLGIFFDMTWWPVYAAANVYHTGRVFATPCDRAVR